MYGRELLTRKSNAFFLFFNYFIFFLFKSFQSELLVFQFDSVFFIGKRMSVVDHRL